MNTNLIKGEIRQNIKTLLIWTGVVLAFTLIAMAFYPSIKAASDDLAALLASMPEGLLKGMGMDTAAMTTSIGFYKIYYAVYIVVIMGIYLFSTGATIFAKEEANQTIEFIMSKPLSRKNYYYSKVGVMSLLFLLIVGVQTGTAAAAIAIADTAPFDAPTFIALHTHGAALVFFFMSVGVAVSMLLDPRINFMGIAVGIVFGSYFLNALSQGTPNMEWLGYFSPFHYADFDINQANYSVDIVAVLGFLLLGALLLAFGAAKFEKRDFVIL